MRFCCKPPSWRSGALIFVSHQKKKKAKGNRSSTSIRTANQAKRRAGGTDRKGLRDGLMECKSKTDLTLPCLVCHGTLAAPDPTSAIFFLCPSPSPRSHACFCFAIPVTGCGILAQYAPYNWEPCLLFSPLPPNSLPFHPSPQISFAQHIGWFLRDRAVHIKVCG